MSERIRPHGLLGLPGEPGGAGGVFFDDFLDVAMLGVLAALQQGIAGAAVEQALIDDPRVRLDVGAAQIVLKRGGFVHGRGLGQGDEQKVREGRIAQALEALADKRQERPARKHGNIPL